jgi:hypothetical protein
VSVDVGYFRRWYGNFTTTDNRALDAADFDAFSITAPAHPDLPGGGGNTISGIYDLKPGSFGRPANNLVTFSDHYGKQIEHWNGVDFSINTRFAQGILLQGGLATGRTSTDNCEVRAKLPELAPATPLDHCAVDTDFLTQVKLLGSYEIPRVAVRFSATFQSVNGPAVAANYNVPSAVAAQSLGRPLAGGAANVTVNLVKPGTMYGERLNQLDLRFSKTLRVGRTTANVNLDLYNALNANPVTVQSNDFAIWQRPQGILAPRFAKVSAQLAF